MIAFDTGELQKQAINTKAKSWFKAGIIDANQWTIIQSEYATNLYSPPFWLRAILFLATILGVYAGVGFFASSILDHFNGSEKTIRVSLILIGIVSFLLLEIIAIKEKKHFRSGVTEALLYMGLSNIIMGVFGFDLSEYSYAFLVLVAGVIASIRYLNLMGVVAAIGAFAFLIFQGFYDLGGYFMAVIPIAFIVIFSIGYWISQKVQKATNWPLYQDSFVVLDSVLLLLIYAGGNYFVVRELSIEMMHVQIMEGEDIPFSLLFHFTTILIPMLYLYFGIRKKEVILIRLGLLIVVASILTFKFYYSLGHTEISLTMAGVAATGLSILLMNYLKTIKNGFTRDQLLTSKWDNLNTEALIISTTMGGNATTETTDSGFGGGDFGGGGAGSEF